MSIIKFDPFRGFESVSRRMSSMLDDFDKGFTFEYGAFVPRVDISEDEKTLEIVAELPGVKKEDVKVKVNDDNILTITGKKVREEEKKDEKDGRTMIRMERGFGEFARSFALPETVKNDSVKADYKDGTLTIKLDKKEPVKPKEIEVKIS